MGTSNEKLKKGRIAKMIGYGALTAGLYTVVFSNQGTVMLNFTKGGLFAATLPVLTAFFISFSHGGFTNYFWQLMGIEASKKRIQQHRQEQEQPVEREQIRPQPRLRA
jgi:hypothetical protein